MRGKILCRRRVDAAKLLQEVCDFVGADFRGGGIKTVKDMEGKIKGKGRKKFLDYQVIFTTKRLRK